MTLFIQAYRLARPGYLLSICSIMALLSKVLLLIALLLFISIRSFSQDNPCGFQSAALVAPEIYEKGQYQVMFGPDTIKYDCLKCTIKRISGVNGNVKWERDLSKFNCNLQGFGLQRRRRLFAAIDSSGFCL